MSDGLSVSPNSILASRSSVESNNQDPLDDLKTLIGTGAPVDLNHLEPAKPQENSVITIQLSKIGNHTIRPQRGPLEAAATLGTLLTSSDQTLSSQTVTDKKVKMAQANMDKEQTLKDKKLELETKIKEEKGFLNRLLNILGFRDAGKLQKVIAELKAYKEAPLTDTLKAPNAPPADMSP